MAFKVVIGRNEGHRLVICFESLLKQVHHIVYVDSGSSDNSLQEAQISRIDCLSLDMNTPFTAARARNEGVFYLVQKHPNLEFIQFVDDTSGTGAGTADWVTWAQLDTIISKLDEI